MICVNCISFIALNEKWMSMNNKLKGIRTKHLWPIFSIRLV